jgi:NAD(P)H-hydrate epimerase
MGMANVYRAGDVKRVDSAAVDAGLALETLMDAAGRAVAKAVWKDHPSKRVLVVCGKGMNGGDGLSCARWLHVWGAPVRVLLHPDAGLEGPSAAMRRALEACGVPIETLEPHTLETVPVPEDVIVDALLGVGFRAPARDLEAAVIARLNAVDKPVYAVDLPSGLEADVHVLTNSHVHASATVALEGFKPVHLFSPAREACGRVVVARIGIPPRIALEHASAHTANLLELRALLPERSRAAHKGTSGRVLVLGGTTRYPGAPALAARGALRAGAGLVEVVTTPGAGLHAPVEATRFELPAWTAEHLGFLREARADAVCAGMGMGAVPTEVLKRLLEVRCPLLLDADALQPNLEPLLQARTLETVLTPHPGEAARLLGTTTDAITRDPLESVHTLSERFNAVVVLKGAPTVVAIRGHVPWVNTTGNPGMASGGTGDTLSGIVAALMGQRLNAWDAARLGVYLHGAAGDVVARSKGYGLMAHELADAVPEAWRDLLEGETDAWNDV